MKTIALFTALLLAAACGGEKPAATVRVPAPSATATIPPSPTPSPTPTLAPGANIGFFGVLRADNTILSPAGADDAGHPIYERIIGSGFVLVIDAKPGTNGAAVGPETFLHEPEDPLVRPDLQIEVSRDLGNGSSAVCDNERDNFGGVPGIDPPDFAATQVIADILNDLGCRFIDGSGSTLGRPPTEACVMFPDGEFRFVDPSATTEFCATIARGMSFPAGDTIVTARVRDTSGIVGPARQIVIRVAP